MRSEPLRPGPGNPHRLSRQRPNSNRHPARHHPDPHSHCLRPQGTGLRHPDPLQRPHPPHRHHHEPQSNPQTFTSALDALTLTTTSPFSESSSDCPTTDAAKTLPAGATCHITLALALNSTIPDGPLEANWTIATSGTHDLHLTGYAQSAALIPSTTHIDFGTIYAPGGLPHIPLPLSFQQLRRPHPPHPRVSPLPFQPHRSLPRHPPRPLRLPAPAHLSFPHLPCQRRRHPQPRPIHHRPRHRRNPPTPHREHRPQPQPDRRSQPRPLPQPGPPHHHLQPPDHHSHEHRHHPPSPSTPPSPETSPQTTTCPNTLAPQTNCSITLTFLPTASGTRSGLLTLTTFPTATAIYASITGTALPILETGPSIFTVDTQVGERFTVWTKVTQPFPALTARTTGPYQAILVEDIGFGHGEPSPSAYSTTAQGTCFNCYLGIRFSPLAVGPQPGTLTLSSTGIPYSLPLTTNGLATSGLIATPNAQQFPPAAIHSTTAPALIALANLTSSPVTVSAPTVTGDFTLVSTPTGGTNCTGTLAPGSTCYAQVASAPLALGIRPGNLTFPTSTGPIIISLTGFGTPDSGLSLNPTALTFQNVPGPAATTQTITLTNTGMSSLEISTPTTATASFPSTTTCTTLAPTQTCTIAVTYLPGTAPMQDILQIPTNAATYTVSLTGVYTSASSTLQLLPTQSNFGPAPIGTVALTRAFTLNNLSPNPQAITLAVPRQFAPIEGNPCLNLAPNASCTFNLTYLPLTTAQTTGTLSAQSAAGATTLAFLDSYGTPAPSTLAITGPLAPVTGILDFGPLISGQSLAQTLTLTATTQPTTIRRVTSNPPFLSTTTCGTSLTASQSCTITLTYAPLLQSPTATPVTDTGTLTIEGDAASTPILITLTGSSTSTTASTAAPRLATYTLSEGGLAFFTTAVGDISPAQTVTLINTGNLPLNVRNLQTTPDFPATTTCSQPIAPQASCTFSLTFSPQSTGPRTGALQISTDAGTSLDFITLYGLSSPSSLLLTPLTLDFGPQLVGTSSTLPIIVTNNGLVPVTFNSLAITSSYTQTNNCPASGLILPPAATCTIQITFTPTTLGNQPGALTVTTSASTLPLTVSVTGTGTQPALSVTPTSLDFGNVLLGFSSNLPITLANTGTAPLQNLTLTPTPTYTNTPCPTTLAPTQTCTTTITFTPVATGTTPGTLTIASSDPNSPAKIPMTGTSTATGGFQLTIDNASTAIATVNQGFPATYTLTVTPLGTYTGPITLTCAPVNPMPYAPCSILPPTVTLAGTPQPSTLTIATFVRITPAPAILLLPLILLIRKRKGRLLAGTLSLILLNSCGGGPDPTLRFTIPGTYTYIITANSTSGAPITQTVTATLIITSKNQP